MKKPLNKVLFDANPLMGAKTGVGYYTDRLIEALAIANPAVTFVGYYYNFLGRKAPLRSSIPNIRWRPIYFMPGPVFNALRRIHVLLPIELLTFMKADFLICTNYLGPSSLFRTPIATTIHDLTFVDLPQYVAKKNLQDLRKYIPAQIRRSSFIMTVSEFSKRRLVDEFMVQPEAVLVTPIPPDGSIRPSHITDMKTLKRLDIAAGKYIFTLGTIEPRKNLLNVFAAYEALPRATRDAYALVVAGKVGWNCADELAHLERMQAAGMNVRHLGYINDEEREILNRKATLFTCASFYEGFGMPILEAMAVGTPCAISDIAVFREVAGKSALFFDHNDVDSIAKTWQKIIDDPHYREVLSAASSMQSKRYKWPEIAGRLQQKIYDTVS